MQCWTDQSFLIFVQAHSDAMGTWGRGGEEGPGSRRPWEGDGRIDLRSVANVLRQLPYHVAWVRGYREAAGILNPTVAIDTALENVRDMQDGGVFEIIFHCARLCFTRIRQGETADPS